MPDKDTIAAIEKLILAIGFNRAVFLIVGFVLIFIVRRVYNDWRSDKETHLALDAKEQALQRVASQERQWRIFYYKEHHKWTDAEIDKYVIKNNFFPDGPTARKAMEEEGQDQKPKTPNKKKKRGDL